MVKTKSGADPPTGEGCVLAVFCISLVIGGWVSNYWWYPAVLFLMAAVPLIVYFTVRLGVYAYHRAKYLASKDCGEAEVDGREENFKPWEKN